MIDVGTWQREAWRRVVNAQWHQQRTIPLQERLDIFMRTAAEAGIGISRAEAGVALASAKANNTDLSDEWHPLNRPTETSAPWWVYGTGRVVDWFAQTVPGVDAVTDFGDGVWRGGAQAAEVTKEFIAENPLVIVSPGGVAGLKLGQKTADAAAQLPAKLSNAVMKPLLFAAGLILAAWFLLRK